MSHGIRQQSQDILSFRDFDTSNHTRLDFNKAVRRHRFQFIRFSKYFVNFSKHGKLLDTGSYQTKQTLERNTQTSSPNVVVQLMRTNFDFKPLTWRNACIIFHRCSSFYCHLYRNHQRNTGRSLKTQHGWNLHSLVELRPKCLMEQCNEKKVEWKITVWVAEMMHGGENITAAVGRKAINPVL